eukprot:365117-Chlamydomonas_euryale.AAC.12
MAIWAGGPAAGVGAVRLLRHVLQQADWHPQGPGQALAAAACVSLGALLCMFQHAGGRSRPAAGSQADVQHPQRHQPVVPQHLLAHHPASQQPVPASQVLA